MTPREAALSLQLAAEERYGAPRRAIAYQAKAAEDGLANAQRKALNPGGRP